MISIKDVAREAGVAVSTVSKVLNNYSDVSPETKEKVRAAAERLQYVPNAVAAALSSKQSGRVALLINLNTRTQVIDEINMQYLAGAIHEAKGRKLDVITIFFSMIEDMSLEEVVAYLQSQHITGLVIYGMGKDSYILQELVKQEIFKTVLIDAPLVNCSTSVIWVDQQKAQMEVARKTIEENHGKKVLYISGKQNGYVTEQRILAMENLEQEMHLELQMHCGDFSERRARELTFEYAERVDVIVCASDLMAIGAMRALIDMDIFRPVCGFDGITLMGYAGKQMYTVRQDFYGISAKAIEELQYLMRGGEGREVVLPYTVVRMQYEDVIC